VSWGQINIHYLQAIKSCSVAFDLSERVLEYLGMKRGELWFCFCFMDNYQMCKLWSILLVNLDGFYKTRILNFEVQNICTSPMKSNHTASVAT
jgi:hypothetical protein